MFLNHLFVPSNKTSTYEEIKAFDLPVKFRHHTEIQLSCEEKQLNFKEIKMNLFHWNIGLTLVLSSLIIKIFSGNLDSDD